MKVQCGLSAAFAAQALGAAFPATTYGDKLRPLISSEKIQKLITTDGLMGNLEAFQAIAEANGGNRAFGLPGYAASVDYIVSQTKNASNFRTWVQDFPALFNRVDSIKFSISRMKPAAAAGAAAVILYSDLPTQVTAGTLSNPNPEEYVPTGYINKADGEALVARLQAGEAIEAYFQQTQIVETRITQNVFSETVDGDPNNVVMLGAHLDSVQAGPGINDDGSGSTLILEIKRALEKFRVKNKVRFAWWGAEENGLLGSKYYNLNASEANKILTYLNFDMVSKGYFGVFDGDGSSFNLSGAPGSAAIEKLFAEHFTKNGVNVTAARFTGGSDYQSFMNIGKPVGGLHTGTGVDQDPCYHQACDTGGEFIPKSPVNASMITPRGLATLDIQWTAPEEGERHTGTCGFEV
ncbi:hypothetical protein SNOG_08944 [Parastagonospora nodorum SN15]|uniref:Peptide hydrolase n=1 Tax=Phaeosphaeria nodorum (strain SN15 / ATCC MYA-4574 / FGSC 10173) TaxID=321614 RepID=Q0UH20_PHANO|nr:hypothetical protein SNOG_08944 [Parastagonospora nodorum SN15]EAT84112.2 hypothetical protein SNOG_08944 [Parastagonospora nodorum SN15]